MSSIELDVITQELISEYYYVLGIEAPPNLSYTDVISCIATYYQNIINRMPGNVYWLDKNAITIGCNQNVLKMFGFKSLNEFKGLSFEELGRIAGWPETATLSSKQDTIEVINTGVAKLNVEEPPIPHQNGKIIYFLTSRVPLRDHNNQVIGIVGISIDITERREAEIALKLAKEKEELANRAKDEFIANMSHDVKAPIAGIVSIAELLTTHGQLQQNDRELIQSILASSRQVLHFFDDCLALSKVAGGNLSFIDESFKLADLMTELTQLFQPMVFSKELNFSIHYHASIPDVIHGARTGLYRILLNLIGNAIKFTESGAIDVYIQPSNQSTPKQSMLEFVIADTGIGIPKEKQSMIFDRYSRVASSMAHGGYEGHGIGLHLVQEFVRALHGEIYVVSEVNQGSRFVVTLPFQLMSNQIETEKALSANETFANNANVQANEKIVPFTCKIKILLIEDNLIAKQVNQILLSSLGCEVDTADSGQIAFEFFSPGKYDLILTDIKLPDIEGGQIIRNIRKAEKNSSYCVPIIGLTTHVTEHIRVDCMNSGANAVMSKPLSCAQLRALIYDYVIQQKSSTVASSNSV